MFLFLFMAVAVTNGMLARKCGVCHCTQNGACVTADCSGQNVSSLPKDVPNSTCHLISRNTRFSIVRDREFQRLVNLTELDLSSNNITNLRPTAFKGLSKLTTFNLSNNKLNFVSPKINPDVFKPLVSLKVLEIQDNAYDGYLDDIVGELRSLEYLKIDGQPNYSFGSKYLQLKNLCTLLIKCIPSNLITSLLEPMFQNVASLASLNISYCNITYVEPNTFKALENLQSLDLSFNENLTFSGVANVTFGLQGSRLRNLSINGIVRYDAVCIKITHKHVQYLGNTSLEVLEVNENRIELVDVDVLSMLPKSLKTIRAGNQRFTFGPYIYNLNLLTGLDVLDLSGKRVSYEPFQRHNKEPFHKLVRREASVNLPPLSHGFTTIRNQSPLSLHISSTGKSHSSHQIINVPPNMTILKFSFSELYYHLADLHLADNNLQYLDLSYNVFTKWSGPFTGVQKVKYFDLSHNFATKVSSLFFEQFTSLKHLNLSWNYLWKAIKADVNGTILRKQLNLEVLDLAQNGISDIPLNFTSGLHSLEVLNVSMNSLFTLQFDYSKMIKSLKFINASQNHIEYISKDLRNIFDTMKDQNFSLDLSFNPLLCTCDTLDLLDWLNSNEIIIHNKEFMKCAIDDRKWVPMQEKYKVLKASCKNYSGLLFGLLCVLVVVTNVIVSAILFRYRWRLIYIYYHVKRRWLSRNPVDGADYDFDAFVSYCDADVDFMRLMLARLEDDQGLKLYVRDRDSIPGVDIADNIIDGIHKSKKSILVLSEEYVAKKWCTFEFQMSKETFKEKTIENKSIIFVCLDIVQTNSIPTEILHRMQKSSPLQYPRDDVTDQSIFWTTLTEEIRS